MVREDLLRQGRGLSNCQIQYNDSGDKNLCVIYCSSNNIYYPDSDDVFEKVIFENDRFEWKNNMVQAAYKNIFIRDIYKAWYTNGISDEVKSIEELIDFLKKETEGYNIVTIGNSAGGHCAIMLGAALNAVRVIVFSPQNNLYLYPAFWENVYSNKDYIKENQKYGDLNNFLEGFNGNIFYFYSAECEEDCVQVNSLKKIKNQDNIYFFPMQSKWHGQNVYGFNLRRILNMDQKELITFHEKICKNEKEINKVIFSIKLVGIKQTVAGLMKKYLRK